MPGLSRKNPAIVNVARTPGWTLPGHPSYIDLLLKLLPLISDI